jgi:hypothetical protein
LLKDLEMYGKEYAIQGCLLYGRGDFEYLAKVDFSTSDDPFLLHLPPVGIHNFLSTY